MTLTLDLSAELETRLHAQADRHGLRLEEYALQVLNQAATSCHAHGGIDALALRGEIPQLDPGSWRNSVGAFSEPDPVLDRILDAGHALREAERGSL